MNQYVILGAGLDTFAYRNPHPKLRVFEVDRPETQAWKRQLLSEAQIKVPEELSFVAFDFEHGSVEQALQERSFNAKAPTFFSWLGVTPYLTEGACMGTLHWIAGMPPGSGVVFDFAIDPALLNPGQRMALGALSRRVAAYGEPLRLFFNPAKLETDLKQMGFRRTELLQGEQINARYFSGRSDKLRVRGAVGHLMGAWV